MSLAGCGGRIGELLEGPELTPVGSGLTTSSTTSVVDAAFRRPESAESSWIGGPADFFRDQRARQPGDFITVKINLNDRASFSNSSARSRKAEAKANTAFDMSIFNILAEGEAEAGAGSNSTASGQGSINRSEKLSLMITAVVREVYPNGAIYVEGSQETLVNAERRDIRISGIVQPRDIDPDNSVDFSRVAEARVQYGGKGQASDVQKPGWGLQLWDKINPF